MKILLAVLGLVAACAQSAHANDYRIAHGIPIENGHLEILEDARLTSVTESKMWSSCIDPGYIFGDDSQQAKAFAAKPLLPMKLRQVDAVGRTIMETIPEQESPIGKIETKNFGGKPGHLFLVDTDDDACFGSYSGRGTFLFTLDHGRIAPIAARGADGKNTQVFLFSSLKSGWRFVKTTQDHGRFEQMLCRPDDAHATKDNLPFLLHYISFRFDGAHWTKAERQKSGFWETDDPFPPHSDFP